MYGDYLLEKLDDIYLVLKKYDWISSSQIFLQSIKNVAASYHEEHIEFQHNSVHIGCAVRIISKSRKYLEKSFSISNINVIDKLKEPKSTSKEVSVYQFSQLKSPNTNSISGDFGKTIDMKDDPASKVVEDAIEYTTEYNMPFSHKATVILEDRLIADLNNINLSENSLRTNYEIETSFMMHNYSHRLIRNISGRSLALPNKEMVREIVNSSILRIKTAPLKVNNDPAIIFHPEVIGKLISIFFSSFNISSLYNEQLWDENLHLYDDPLRHGGYNSTLFDDEGILTNPLQLISNGRLIDYPKDLQSTDWKEGGNGFRVEWYQPTIRSYRYKIQPNITNLVLSGGTGQGKYFTDRPGSVLLIRKAHISFGLGENNGDFILYSQEAQYYKDGDLQNPVNNIAIIGNLHEILSRGRLSSDQDMTYDQLLLGSIYCGWLVIPPSVVSLRS